MPEAKKKIAYFCAEFGIDTNLPTYAGGLGILAGDTLLEAAEQNRSIYGVGLLYQGKYFLQEFTPDGMQTEDSSPFQTENTKLVLPVEIMGKRLIVSIKFFGEEIKIAAYQQRLGDTATLYLLTSDLDGNPDSWRDVMSCEYCCGDDAQIKQQFILGLGGIKILKKLNIKPDIYHFQEGRPIFAHWEIAKNIIETTKVKFTDALEKAKESIVYTNHTLVPDGNLIYPKEMLESYASSFVSENQIPIDPQKLIEPGLVENGFSITKYALNTSSKQSAVSKLHGKLCKKLWPSYDWKVITNGVYIPRWQKSEFANPSITDYALWEAHLSAKRDLARVVAKRSGFTYSTDSLVIGWARRITPYKQIDKIFKNIERLQKILKNTERPVQILMAGKAHPGDDMGKKCIQDVMKIMTNHLSGNALFIPNYDIALAYHMVSGVDLWLNTPELGKEACGTSGMKALSNGVLNLTVPDGWTAEVDWEGVGWTLDNKNISESIYQKLEEDIIPMFYNRVEYSYSPDWISMMKKSIELSKKFSTKKMLEEYEKALY